jgi:hypothetical protein
MHLHMDVTSVASLVCLSPTPYVFLEWHLFYHLTVGDIPAAQRSIRCRYYYYLDTNTAVFAHPI